MTVYAIGTRRTNAELIADCHTLGYLRDTDRVLDPTYGLGRMWRNWTPPDLTASDLNPLLAPLCRDFTDTGWPDLEFDAVVFDPPYKLNGTSTGRGAASSDRDYGVEHRASWQGRHDLIRRGITELARITRRTLIVKCQDQVCGGRVRWQTLEFADHATTAGFNVVDVLHVVGSRPQPGGRTQRHARRDYSTALILERARR